MGEIMSLIATALGYVVGAIYGIVNNYGLAIIIFTLIFKIIMIPFSIKQQTTMKKNAVIQEKSKAIQAKYANDQMKQSEELMKLYKEENMSPFSGCLISIVQMVIFLSVFYLVSQPLTYIKHVDSNVINTYVEQIKQENNADNVKYAEIAVIKNFAATDDRVNLNMNFLGLNLSYNVVDDFSSDWKVIIIPVLYIITNLINTKVMTKMNGLSNNKDDKSKNDNKSKEKDEEVMETMQDMTKSMNLMMPILTVMIALVAPLGLALYWLISNLFMFFERFLTNIINKKKEEKEQKQGEVKALNG